MNLRELQQEASQWAKKNFPDAKPYQPLLGVAEEIGELCHAHLKAEQGIRNSTHEDKVDAVADIVIFLLHYCTLNDIDIDSAVQETWAKVSKRDWTKNKVNGETNELS